MITATAHRGVRKPDPAAALDAIEWAIRGAWWGYRFCLKREREEQWPPMRPAWHTLTLESRDRLTQLIALRHACRPLVIGGQR